MIINNYDNNNIKKSISKYNKIKKLFFLINCQE